MTAQADDDAPGDFPNDASSQVDRRIRRDQLREQLRAMGGIVGGAEGDEVSDAELAFLEHVVAWETGPRSSHRDWLARKGATFIPPAELFGPRLKEELWRLIRALAKARVFLYRTNHLSDTELYQRLWSEVLPTECPDGVRTPDDGNHWDFAEPTAVDREENWLRFYASPAERAEWQHHFPSTELPARCRPPYRRDHRLPVRD